MNIENSFELFVDKFENLSTFDESIYLDRLPIAIFAAEYVFFGALWGGKILRYEVRTEKFNVYNKHSATVTSLCSNDELEVLISGSSNGEIVIWTIEYKNSVNQLP